jgi:hypothetical protein
MVHSKFPPWFSAPALSRRTAGVAGPGLFLFRYKYKAFLGKCQIWISDFGFRISGVLAGIAERLPVAGCRLSVFTPVFRNGAEAPTRPQTRTSENRARRDFLPQRNWAFAPNSAPRHKFATAACPNRADVWACSLRYAQTTEAKRLCRFATGGGKGNWKDLKTII